MPTISGGNVTPTDGRPRGILTGAGAPAANYGAGNVAIGAMYVNTTSGTLYICTATNGTSTATWTVVGAQVGP